MKKFAIALFALVVIALPVAAAALNGSIDFDGSRAAEKAALLEKFNEIESAKAKAPVGEVEIGEVTVAQPEVQEAPKAPVAKKVAKKAPAKVSKNEWSCRTETMKNGENVKFCSTIAFRVAVDRSEGAI